MTLTLAGSLARLIVVIPGGGGRGIWTLVLLRVIEELPEGHVASLLGLVIEVAPGHVAAGVHGVHALIASHQTLLPGGHPFQLLTNKSQIHPESEHQASVPRVEDKDGSEMTGGDEDAEPPA